MKPNALPSRSYLLKLFRYDGVNLIWKQPPWNKQYLLGQIAGCCVPDGYVVVKINRRIYRVHRVIFKMKTGREPEQIDHKNRIRNDNKWSNLRASTHLKNHRNRTNTRYPDLPPGVGMARDKKRYLAFVHVGKYKYLGTFTSKREAALVAREARLAR